MRRKVTKVTPSKVIFSSGEEWPGSCFLALVLWGDLSIFTTSLSYNLYINFKLQAN